MHISKFISDAEFSICLEQVQASDPRLEWRALQEDMLRSYLTTAQEDLQVDR